MIYEQSVNVKLNSSNMWHYRKLGYVCPHKGDIIEVNVFDLQPTTHVEVKCKCDFCGKEFERAYISVCKSKKHTCGNQECKKLLRAETNLERFGVTNTAFSKELMQKAAEKFEKNYGIGSANHDDYVRRRNETNMHRYGTKRVDREDSQSKRLKSMFKNFDEAKCKKGTRKAVSKEQVRLCEMIDGYLNYKLSEKIYIDIALVEKKISIEYNGNGHVIFKTENDDNKRDLESHKLGWKNIRLSSVTMRKMSQEEFFAVVRFCEKVFETTDIVFAQYLVDEMILKVKNDIYHLNEIMKEVTL